jgi:hypothetical protein
MQSLSISIEGTAYERRIFYVFVRLGGNAMDTAEEADLELLTSIVPTACHHAPAIRSAILCITSFFASLADPTRQDKHLAFAEFQYNKAIRSLALSESAKSDWMETLIACILLLCIEAHRNDPDRALVHTRGAIAIV